MSKKNRNKNRQRATHPSGTSQPFVKPVTEAEMQEIETKNIELREIVPAENLSPEAESKLKEAEAHNDLLKYWNYVKEINKRLEALTAKAKEENEKVEQSKKEHESSKKETDNLKSELKKKLEEQNKKDKELTEREFQLDNGEYTGVIRRLLDALKDTERKIFVDTENILNELSEFHQNNLQEYLSHQKENFDYEKQVSDLKREKKKFEIEKIIFEEDVKEEFETKFSQELNFKIAELERLTRKVNKLESENNKLNQLFEDFQNAFGSKDPLEILSEYSFVSKELESLKKEIDARPNKFEFDSKQEQIEELKAKITEYQSKINERELLELKRLLSNADSYIIEINAYKNQVESAKIREESLKKTIADLSITIDQLKGESANKADAFEFAKKCDADIDNLGFNHLENKHKNPRGLIDLITYVQQWMAFKSDKPFYYSQKTIRIFLAGLHMSPISILQGISGTGKTSLPREFAKALVADPNYTGIDEENMNNSPYRICAIQSGWRDNMDLMGYYNSFEHKYKETDFFKALYLANQPKYIDTLFLIILDEMNLSRPEHYFADFLSLLEQSPDERFINLTNTPNEVLPQSIKGGKLKVPENVRFIGTANHDETTLEFAPKTYDRSNLMEMPRNHPGNAGLKPPAGTINLQYSWLEYQFRISEKLFKKECDEFVEFTSRLEKNLLSEKGIGIGNRLENQAEKFISVFLNSGNPEEKDSDFAVAADHLITSRLFRTLKNRYDLDKNNLSNFKKEYLELFNNQFNTNPEYAVALLDDEIKKK